MRTVSTRTLVSLVAAGLLGATGAAAQEEAPRESEERAESRTVAVRPGPWIGGGGGRLGVRVDDLDRRAAEENDLGRPRGARVTDVSEDSPAADAGLRADDVIVRFDGEEIRSARHLARLVRETPPERVVDLAFLRDGERRTAEVRIGERTAGWPGLDSERMEEIHGRIEDAMERRGEAMERLDDLEGLEDLEGRLEDLDLEIEGRAFAVRGRGRLGVRLQPLTDQLADHFGADDGGALVAAVRDGSPAAAAGVRAGDVIVRVGDRDVRSPGDVARVVRSADAGPVTVIVVRDGDERSVTVEIPERERSGKMGAARPASPSPDDPPIPAAPPAVPAPPTPPAVEAPIPAPPTPPAPADAPIAAPAASAAPAAPGR